MIANENPNNFQSAAFGAYRFNDFEVDPGERLLKRRGHAIPLTRLRKPLTPCSASSVVLNTL